MEPGYEYISSIDYINSLTFDYVETYSFQRGEEFEKDLMIGRTELVKLKHKQLVSTLDLIEQRRFEKLSELYGHTQYLMNAKGEFHPFSKRISSYGSLDSKVMTLREILRTEIKDVPRWMCAPIYRDAIVFYNADKIVSTLNVCLNCEYMETSLFKHINGDIETYRSLRQFLIDCGHEVEDEMPVDNRT